MTDRESTSDTPDAATLATTRRNTLKATGSLGLGSLLQLGGGPEADPMYEYKVPTYRVPESDLDSPGVIGRRVEITAGGSNWSAGDQLVDTGETWELINAGVDMLNAEDAQTKSLDAYEDNESVVGDLSRKYRAAVKADDGTHYALHYDGSDIVLYKTTETLREDSWTEVYRWASVVADYDKLDLHLTATGTLLTGFDSNIKRSTDRGSTWSNVLSLSGGASGVWTFTESSGGTILASENNALNLYQSTDDGGSWSTLADSTTFSAWNDHIHKVRYHSANDYIIVTGGDSGTDGWYRYNGTSWHFFQTNPSRQFVGITTHPSKGDTYYLFEDAVNDDAGVWEITDDGTSTVDATQVAKLNVDDDGSNATGAFSALTINASNPYLMCATYNLSQNYVAATADLNAKDWRRVGEISDSSWSITTEQGAYGHVVDPSNVSYFITEKQRINSKTLNEEVYGSPLSRSVDQRTAFGEVDASKGIKDGDGISHRGELADINDAPPNRLAKLMTAAQVIESMMEADAGSTGSVNFPDGVVVEMRMPGDSGGEDEAKVYDPAAGFDPSGSGSVRFDLTNVSYEQNTDARIVLALTDDPSGTGYSSDDFILASTWGDGRLRARTSNDGIVSTFEETDGIDNTFLNNLEYFKISWDGSSVTAEVSNGSSTVTATESTNYPSGENLFIKFMAYDSNALGGHNVDFDISDLIIS